VIYIAPKSQKRIRAFPLASLGRLLV